MARTKVQVLGTDGKPLRHLTQWDCNREMVIKGLPAFTQQPEIHYWDRDRYRAIVVPTVSVDGGIRAKIPNILLQNTDDVVFTVFFRSAENEGESVFIHNIPIFRATKPEDYTWTENINYINFTELIKEAEALLELLNAAGNNVILISQRALEEAAKAAAAAEEAQRLAAEFADQIADLPNKQNWGTVKMGEEPGINSPSKLQSYFFALRKQPNRVYQFEITKDKNRNIVTACGGVPDGLDPSASAFITVTIPYSEAGGFVEHIEYRMRKSGDVRCKDYSTTHDTESAPWYDSGWYDPTADVSGSSIFFAEYEVTSFQDVLAAFKAGKNIWLKVMGRRFMPLLQVDDAADPQIFTFYLSLGVLRNRIDVSLQSGDTYWESTNFETSAAGISAIVPTNVPKKNVQAYLDYLNEALMTYTAFAVCHDEAASASTTGNTWYIPKALPKPSGKVGMMLDVFWEHGQVNSLGYDVRLVWGAPGEPDNVEIVGKASTTDNLTGTHSIPAEGTVRYQLEESNGRKRWRYVSGPLIPNQFSTATAAATADKVVPGLALGYLPGMEIYVQLDAGNTAPVMRLVPDEGATLPVYGNGEGAATGEIPAGYILHLKNAGDHWQIINQPGGKDSGAGGITALFVDQGEAVANSRELQRLIDEASAAGGGMIYIPAGTYAFGATGRARYGSWQYYCVKMKSNVTIFGDGDSTVLKPTGTYQSGLDMFYRNDYRESIEAGEAPDKSYLENCNFHDFKVDSIDSHTDVYGTAGKAFMLNVFKNCHWQRITACNTDGTGIGVDCPVASTITDCVCYNCGKASTPDNRSGASGIGIGFGLSEEESMVIRGCVCYSNANYGIFYEHQRRFKPTMYQARLNRGLSIEGCTCYDNYKNFGAERAINVHISDCYSGKAKNHGYYVANSELCTVDGCISNAEFGSSFVVICAAPEGNEQTNEVKDIAVIGCVSKYSETGFKVYRAGAATAKFLRISISGCTVFAPKANAYVTGGVVDDLLMMGNGSTAQNVALSATGDRHIIKGNSWQEGDHAELTGRDQPDQHPMKAITGLETALGKKLSNEDTIPSSLLPLASGIEAGAVKVAGVGAPVSGLRAYQLRLDLGGPYSGVAYVQIPSAEKLNDGVVRATPSDSTDGVPVEINKKDHLLRTPVGLGITGARVGQYLEILEVGPDGVPTKYKAVNKPGGGGGDSGTWVLIDTVTQATDAPLRLDKEPDGTPYNFSSVRVMVECVDKPGSYSMAIGLSLAYADILSKLYIDYKYTHNAIMDVVNNRGYWDSISYRGTNRDNLPSQLAYGDTNKTPVQGRMIKNVYSIGNVPAGTVIKVWAVRA